MHVRHFLVGYDHIPCSFSSSNNPCHFFHLFINSIFLCMCFISRYIYTYVHIFPICKFCGSCWLASFCLLLHFETGFFYIHTLGISLYHGFMSDILCTSYLPFTDLFIFNNFLLSFLINNNFIYLYGVCVTFLIREIRLGNGILLLNYCTVYINFLLFLYDKLIKEIR